MSFINWGDESSEQKELRRRYEEEQMLFEQAVRFARTTGAMAGVGSGGIKKKDDELNKLGTRSLLYVIDYASDAKIRLLFIDFETGTEKLIKPNIDHSIYNVYISQSDIKALHNSGYVVNFPAQSGQFLKRLFFDASGNELGSKDIIYSGQSEYLQEINHGVTPFGIIWQYNKIVNSTEVAKEIHWFNGVDSPVIHTFPPTPEISSIYIVYDRDAADRRGNFMVSVLDQSGKQSLYQLGKTKLKVADIGPDEVLATTYTKYFGDCTVVQINHSSNNSISRLIFVSSDQKIIDTIEYSTSEYFLSQIYFHGTKARILLEINNSSTGTRTMVTVDSKLTKTLSVTEPVNPYYDVQEQQWNPNNDRTDSRNAILLNYMGGGYYYKAVYIGENDDQFYSKTYADPIDLYEQLNSNNGVYVLTDKGTGSTWYSVYLEKGEEKSIEIGPKTGSSPGGHLRFGKNMMALFDELTPKYIKILEDGDILAQYSNDNGVLNMVTYNFGVLLFHDSSVGKLFHFGEKSRVITEVSPVTGSFDIGTIGNTFDNNSNNGLQNDSPNLENVGCRYPFYVIEEITSNSPQDKYIHILTPAGVYHTSDLLTLQYQNSNFISNIEGIVPTQDLLWVSKASDNSGNFNTLYTVYGPEGLLGQFAIPTGMYAFDTYLEGGRAFFTSWNQSNPQIVDYAAFTKKGIVSGSINGGVACGILNISRVN